MIALLVGIINGIFDIAYNMQRTFEASVVNDYGESLKIEVVADSGRPSLLWNLGWNAYKAWWLAWRVGATPISTVNIGVTITPTATNVVNLKVTYYIKAKCGSNQYNPLSGNQISATSGSPLSYSTGAISVDSHLSSIGVSTTQDQTVDYYVYCKVEGTGAISGETLAAEVTETKFDTITFDYGGIIQDSATITPPIADTYVERDYPYRNNGDATLMRVQTQDDGGIYRNKRCFLKFDINSIPNGATITLAKLKLKSWLIKNVKSGVTDVEARRVSDDSWVETEITWDTQPSYGSVEDTIYINQEYTWYEWTVTSWVQNQYAGDKIVGFCLKCKQESYDSTERYVMFATKELGGSDPGLYVEYEFADWSLSWNWFNLPLSVVSLPIGQQFLAIIFMILAFAIWAVSREKKRSKRRSKR